MSMLSTIKTVFADSSKKKVLLIYLYGTITERNSNMQNSFSAFDLTKELLKAIKYKSYDGIIVRINSPGGAAAASEEVAETIQMVKSKLHIPIISIIGDLCASGAYLIASVTDKIYANKLSLVGSIGAIMQIPNFTGLADKLGVKLITAASGKMKDLGNPAREITNEEKEYLNTLVKDAADQFIHIVQTNRNIDSPDMFDGRIITAHDALNNNLIDAIGTYSDAVKYMCSVLNITEDRLAIYEYQEKMPLVMKILKNCNTLMAGINIPSLGLKF